MSYQKTLFTEPKYQRGDIVRQTGDIHGKFEWKYLFLQIRRTKVVKEEVKYLAHPVPYGKFPSDRCWLLEKYAEATGLSWRVPSWDELKDWEDEREGLNWYNKGLNLKSPDDYEPFPQEEELVKMIVQLGEGESLAEKDFVERRTEEMSMSGYYD